MGLHVDLERVFQDNAKKKVSPSPSLLFSRAPKEKIIALLMKVIIQPKKNVKKRSKKTE
jgi:hypothetical protein